jgi:hypothetical protein
MSDKSSHYDVTKKPVWLITGCSTGFGRALAELLIGRGYLAYLPHWSLTPDGPSKLACFSTGPAVGPRNRRSGRDREPLG